MASPIAPSPQTDAPNTCVFIISAPSGSGKTTLVRELFRMVPDLEFSISYTTRPPRGSEQNGRDYFFVDRPEFERMIAVGAFLEHAEVFGNFYGTAWSFLEDARRRGRDLVLDIDVQGAAQVRARLPQAASIFIAPPDRATLAWRLESRGLDRPETVAQRLGDASREIAAYNRYGYVIINDRLAESIEQLQAVVLSERSRARGEPLDPRWAGLAEACRQHNVAARLEPVLRSFGLEAGPANR